MSPPPAPWHVDPATFATIVGMALVTYASRAGGYWLFRRIRPNPFVRAVLGYLPGTLFVSYVSPALLQGGPPQWVGAAATVGLMLLTRSIGWAIMGGTGTAWVVWLLLR